MLQNLTIVKECMFIREIFSINMHLYFILCIAIVTLLSST
jgi:hypothetical protein